MSNISIKTWVETGLWIAFGLFGLYLCIDLVASGQTGFLAAEDDGAFTAATWPRLIFGMIIVIALVNLAVAWFNGENPSEEGASAGSEGSFIQRNIKLIGFVSVSLLYGILLAWFGFYLLTPFFILAILLLSGERRWVPLLVLAVGLHLLLVVLFYRVLGMTLPTGTGVFYNISASFQNFLYSIF
ncbi:tripartite tricarboxylate transporter TctB family protein [Alphaproteobacteria bacterium]|jgi:hypothetical protein|nr:tripartite tricarboxylate transporter TctB family protein [Alphaproteobacteria bacterium]